MRRRGRHASIVVHQANSRSVLNLKESDGDKGGCIAVQRHLGPTLSLLEIGTDASPYRDAMDQRRLQHVLARHEQHLRRVARMLAAGHRREQMPKDAEFHVEEIQHLDSVSADLVADLLGHEPTKAEWVPPGRVPYEKEYWSCPGHLSWLEAYQAGLHRSKNYLSVFLTRSEAEVILGDKIIGGSKVVLYPKAQAGDISASGAVHLGGVEERQLRELAEELGRLRRQMRAESDPDNTDHDVELGAVALAEKAARAGDRSGTLSHLRAAGQWCLDIGTRIGVNLVTEVIQASTGLSK